MGANQCCSRQNIRNRVPNLERDKVNHYMIKIDILSWQEGHFNPYNRSTLVGCDENSFIIHKPLKRAGEQPKVFSEDEYVKRFQNSEAGIFEFAYQIQRYKSSYMIEDIEGLGVGWEPKPEKFKLTLGDIIKIGRTSFEYKLLISNSNELEKSIFNSSYEDETGPQFSMESSIRSASSSSEVGKPQCRICLSYSSTSRNPMIAPCQCSGSTKYLHLQCFKQWVLTDYKNIPKTQQYLQLSMKKQRCQICKALFTDFLDFKYLLFDCVSEWAKEKLPLIVFEACTVYDDEVFKFFYIHSFKEENTFSIGRGNSNALCVKNDRNVSKKHANFEFKGKQLYMEDVGSRYGTFLRLQKQLELQPQVRHNFVIRKNCFSISLEKNNSYFSSSTTSTSSDVDNRQNWHV